MESHYLQLEKPLFLYSFSTVEKLQFRGRKKRNIQVENNCLPVEKPLFLYSFSTVEKLQFRGRKNAICK